MDFLSVFVQPPFKNNLNNFRIVLLNGFDDITLFGNNITGWFSWILDRQKSKDTLLFWNMENVHKLI